MLQFPLLLTADILYHLRIVAVARQRVDAAQLGAHLMCLAEDGDLLIATHNLGAQRRRLAIAHTEDGSGGVVDVVGQMVFHTSGLHHAAGGDDDAGLMPDVELLALHDALYIVQTVEAEWVGVGLAVFGNTLVEALSVQTHYIGSTDTQRTVDKDVDVGQQLDMLQAVEGVDNLLRTPDGEARDDEFAFLLGTGVKHRLQQFGLGILQTLVQTVAVGALHDEVVHLRERLGVLENLLVVTSDVAREAQFDVATPLADIKINERRAEDMTCIVELHRHLALNVELFVVGDTDEAAHTGLSVLLVVDGLHRFEPLRLALLVEGDGILLLNAARVGQHDGTEVARGGRAEHRATEAQFVDIGYQAAVVDMGVTEDEVVYLTRREAQVAVHGVGLETLALIHATVEQYLQSAFGRYQVFATRHLASGTHKLQFHSLIVKCRTVKPYHIIIYLTRERSFYCPPVVKLSTPREHSVRHLS